MGLVIFLAVAGCVLVAEFVAIGDWKALAGAVLLSLALLAARSEGEARL